MCPTFSMDGNPTEIQYVPNKVVYWEFIKNKTTKDILTASFWVKQYGLDLDALEAYICLPYNVIRDTKIQSLQFKILNLTYPCNMKLKQWRVKLTEICSDCQECDNLIHHFWGCQEIKQFWRTLSNWWITMCDKCPILVEQHILLGYPKGGCHFINLNYIIMCAKWYIYRTKYLRRVDLTVGVSYDADLKEVRRVLEDIISKEERVLKDPEHLVAVGELADNSVNFVVRLWVNSGDYWGVTFDMNETIKTRMDEAGIGIPYPQRDIHLYQHNVE